MKNILRNICICAFVAVLASCVNSGNTENANNTASGDKGVLTVKIDTRAENGANHDYILRIFKNENGASTLVRKYNSAKDEQPEYIWLLEGNYTATVESGTAVAASFDETKKFFYANKSFDILAGETTNVDLVAVVQNIPVEVTFDETIVNDFQSGYYVDVVADDSTKLQYTESKKGFFIMPEGVTTLSWHFVGTFVYSDGEVVNLDKSGTIQNVEPKKSYKLSFKFSKDTTGFLGDLSVVVDESVEERNDHLAFNPDPELRGVDFDLEKSHNYTGGERKYVAISPSEFIKVNITADGKKFDPVNTTVAGVSLEGLNTTQLYITLSDDFFNSLSGGSQNITLYVEDTEGASVSKKLPYNLQGVYNSIINLWGRTATLYATVFGTPSSVVVACRKANGEWENHTATAAGDNTYTAVLSDIATGSSYEYALVVNNTYVGTSRNFVTEEGVQIPNGDLEDWCTEDGVVIPFSTGTNSYWCTGNYGTASLSKNITQSSTDVRPGSKGKKSAYMDSEYIVVKFAAGNLYVGSWGGMNGMNATVYFGQPFSFNAKPKAVRFWAKWNCGTIDKVSGGVGAKGDPDLCKIFCCMAKDRHSVYSGDAAGTSFSPSDANIKSGDSRYRNILYSAYMETTQSQAEWKQVEIPFTFYGTNPNEIPTHLILTFTCSGYGDYFDGSTDSFLYVDDIELVY